MLLDREELLLTIFQLMAEILILLTLQQLQALEEGDQELLRGVLYLEDLVDLLSAMVEEMEEMVELDMNQEKQKDMVGVEELEVTQVTEVEEVMVVFQEHLIPRRG